VGNKIQQKRIFAKPLITKEKEKYNGLRMDANNWAKRQKQLAFESGAMNHIGQQEDTSYPGVRHDYISART
jgi:hypothetical protein